jgi:erythromycin esterase-like protein
VHDRDAARGAVEVEAVVLRVHFEHDGVIYRPETERLSHYFHAQLPRQFDAMLHYDTTRAVKPLERTAAWERGELPETYPSAL